MISFLQPVNISTLILKGKFCIIVQKKNMGAVVKITKKSNRQAVSKALKKLQQKRTKPAVKTLVDFYGLMPDTYPDGLSYQKKIRDEWR